MLIAYWIVAGVLALLYLLAGGNKVLRTQEQLRPMMGWVDVVPMPMVRTIGALEMLGAIGLIVPPLVGIAPRLAFAAAICLIAVQVAGIAVHVSRGEFAVLGLNGALLLLAIAATVLGTIWL